jgi:ubiquinone biosynthesis protein
MDIIKTGIEFTKTIKNVGRLKEILSVFALNGFDEFIIKSKLNEVIPGFVLPRRDAIKSSLEDYEAEDFWESVGYRLRKSFESLGPGFIKIGQLLATRDDIFEKGLIDELKKLQNNVKSPDFSESKKTIEDSLKGPLENSFAHFEQKPLATASIASVYRAKLKSGEQVVVKVKKNNIKEVIDVDFQIFKYLVFQLERVSNDIKFLGLSRVIDDFYISVQNELNLNLERVNLKKIKKNTEAIDKNKLILIPNVYEEFSSEDILVMDYLDGRSFNLLKEEDVNQDLADKLIEAVSLFIQSLLKDGVFHADLHGGNFFILENGQLGIVDFGSVGTLSRRNRNSLISILYSMVTHNFENLVYEFLDVADYDEIPNYQILIRDMKDCLSPFMGLNTNELSINIIFYNLIRVLSKHKIFLPREWYIIFRAIIVLDGVGRSIGLEINVYELLEKDIRSLVKGLVSKDEMLEESMWFARDILNSMRVLPRHGSWFLKEFSKNNYALQIRHHSEGIDKGIQNLTISMKFLGWILLSGVLILSGVLLLAPRGIPEIKELPILVIVFWLLSLGCVIKAVRLKK